MRTHVQISLDEVDHVAELAHIGLTDDERAQLRAQLSTILDYVNLLNEMDASGVPPSAQVIPLTNAMRSDEPRPCLPREAVLANAPRQEDGYFRVPPVFGGE